MQTFNVILMLFAAVSAQQPNYEGYQVLSAIPENDSHLKLLKDLNVKDGLDFLKISTRFETPAEFLVPRDQIENVFERLSINGLKYNIISSNVAEDLKKSFQLRNDEPRVFGLDKYNTFEDILSGLDDLLLKCPSSASCVLEDIGLTPENKPIRLFKIVKPSQRKIVWFDSAIHAREWLAPATNLKLLDAILSQEDPNAVSLLNKYDFYFLIIMNPDGYSFSWESPDNRLWRKNRTPNPGSVCRGTDLNRNFDVNWMNDGTSTEPCSDVFGGSSAASETETQNVQNYLRSIGSRVIALTSIHSTAQMILLPYGHTDSNEECAIPADHEKQLAAGNAFADAIENTYDTIWERGTGCSTICK
ncbi:DgyrCDS3209 [Dimorphilus gyrociliatus]|uniref:DgyrCDS3209 n=1 Tax=Dimorphilus gyrociliatus TaxID=2664684 RepID=A0A7I8VCI4_9ANNE|nr:DgyrCDS3209 [Dimorphilus gyrociliatus]